MHLNVLVARVVDAIASPTSHRQPQHALTSRERDTLRRAANRPVTLPSRMR